MKRELIIKARINQIGDINADKAIDSKTTEDTHKVTVTAYPEDVERIFEVTPLEFEMPLEQARELNIGQLISATITW
jgi:hypothetical protein